MNVLTELINEALAHQGGHATFDGNGDVTRFIELPPAGARYLSLNDVLTPKSGSQVTIGGNLAMNSLVARAGAEIIRIQPVEQSPAGANITLKQLEGKFVTVESASFALVPPLQMRVMEAAKDAPNLASAVNIGAFNFGNAIGAALGGAVINAGWGYPAISLAGAAMAGLGLLMVLGSVWRSRAVEVAVV